MNISVFRCAAKQDAMFPVGAAGFRLLFARQSSTAVTLGELHQNAIIPASCHCQVLSDFLNLSLISKLLGLDQKSCYKKLTFQFRYPLVLVLDFNQTNISCFANYICLSPCSFWPVISLFHRQFRNGEFDRKFP